MSFDIHWMPEARDQMGEYIRSSPDRHSEFATTLRRLTKALSRNPYTAGESRGGSERVGFFGRLTVYYEVDSAGSKVFVTRVHMPFDNLEPL